MDKTRTEINKAIKRELKARGADVSVRGSRGTGYGYTHIYGKNTDLKRFTETDVKAIREVLDIRLQPGAIGAVVDVSEAEERLQEMGVTI